jgi:hypothetical protein
MIRRKSFHGWMDGLKVGEIKISARGPQIGPNVHHTDEKLKDQKETNRQIDRIRQYKKEEMFIRMNESRSHSESATRQCESQKCRPRRPLIFFNAQNRFRK